MASTRLKVARFQFERTLKASASNFALPGCLQHDPRDPSTPASLWAVPAHAAPSVSLIKEVDRNRAIHLCQPTKNGSHTSVSIAPRDPEPQPPVNRRQDELIVIARLWPQESAWVDMDFGRPTLERNHLRKFIRWMQCRGIRLCDLVPARDRKRRLVRAT